MLASAFVYILTNSNNSALYTGVTVDLPRRIWEHKTKQNPKSFTARYQLHKLVYYEMFESIIEAIAREKQIKGRCRKYKDKLINGVNPNWDELIVSPSDLFKLPEGYA